MSRKGALSKRFEITDEAGSLAFEARGRLGAVTLHDPVGLQVAAVTKRAFSGTRQIDVGGEQVAQVRHTGILGDRYQIDTSLGVLTARGHLFSGNFSLTRDGTLIAQMARQFSVREKFAVDISDDENAPFILAVMLAIEAIHDRRSRGQ